MAIVTLTGTNLGADVGPFNIYHTTEIGGNLIESGVTRNTLDSGWQTSQVYDLYIVRSTGVCDNKVDVALNLPSPTPTPTITPTPTTSPESPDPVVVTNGIDPLGTDTATYNGLVSVVGTPSYNERGFVIVAGNSTPTVSNTKLIASGSGVTGTYTYDHTGLTPGQQYSVRAYVLQSGVPFYGETRVYNQNLVGYYQLQDCSTLSTNHRSTQTIEDITLGTSDRVTAGGNTYIVVGTTTDLDIPAVGTLTDTGETGCPATERWYNIYDCDGGASLGVGYYNSGTLIPNGSAFHTGNNCIEIGTETTEDPFAYDFSAFTIYDSCTDCNNANP